MSAMSVPLAIGIGAFAGALMRFYVSEYVVRLTGEELRFVGTLTVNLVGCLGIGVLTAIASHNNGLPPLMQKCLITGLLGSLTTFSTFAFDSLQLLQNGRMGAAVMNILCNLIAGLLLVWLGMMLAGGVVSGDTV